MLAKAADQRIHRVHLCMTEKAHPQLEIARVAPCRIHVPARSLPQTAPPERGLLLNVPVGAAEQKAKARPAHQRIDPGHRALLVEHRAPPGDPLDFRTRSKNSADQAAPATMQLIGRAYPTHDVPGSAR